MLQLNPRAQGASGHKYQTRSSFTLILLVSAFPLHLQDTGSVITEQDALQDNIMATDTPSRQQEPASYIGFRQISCEMFCDG